MFVSLLQSMNKHWIINVIKNIIPVIKYFTVDWHFSRWRTKLRYVHAIQVPHNLIEVTSVVRCNNIYLHLYCWTLLIECK